MKKYDHAAAAYKRSSRDGAADKGFIKTSVSAPDRPGGSGSGMSGYQKAAKFLLLIGPKQAAEVLKQFPQEDVEKIVREIAVVRKLKKAESADILSSMGGLVADKSAVPPVPPDGIVAGGADKAKSMLVAAFGRDEGKKLFSRILPFGGRRPFDFLDELQPEQIMTVIKNEPPYVMSIVLSFLEPELSSKIIKKLPPESRREIVLRMARQGKIAPGVIEKMEGIFRDRIRAQGRVITEEIDGKAVLAGILKHMELGTEEKILDDLSETRKDLAGEIKERIYTTDLILRMDDKDVQLLLRDFADSELAVIIKGKSEELRKKLLDNLSGRRRVMIEEESVYIGEMLRSDVDKATKELMLYLMELEQKGQVIIPRADEEYI